MTPVERTGNEVFAAAYDDVRDRLSAEPLDDQSTVSVPACPGWTVRDVIAHLAGLCEDWVEHRFDGYASPAWTANQIARFGAQPIADIVRAWVSAADAFARLPDDTFIGSPPRWAFGDAVVHEADIRGATNRGRVPPEAVTLALRGAISRWRDVLNAASAPSLLIHSRDGEDWLLTTGDDDGSEVSLEVDTPSYELFRALAGRRTIAQVREWHWSGDPGPVLQRGLSYPFRWAAHTIRD